MRKFPPYRSSKKLNIGSGNDFRDGYINIDIRDINGNMVWDVRDGIPFPDESADEIFTSHFLEHLNEDETIEFLIEALRVLKYGGILDVWVPHASSPFAVFPGHKTFWNELKVEAYQRSEVPLPKFTIIKNEEVNQQLHFSIIKGK